MVEVPLETYLSLLLPSVAEIAIFIVAWWATFHFSRQRESRGLYLVSLGFMARWITGSIWLAVYWIFWGGPFGYIRLIDQGLPLSEIGRITEIVDWAGGAVWLASMASMIILVIHGALTITRERQVVTAATTG